jgi:translation initiation factor 2 beta subunit (eIF-2beta)/eIF-5
MRCWLVILLWLAPCVAWATWTEYSYLDDGFSISFPDKPTITASENTKRYAAGPLSVLVTDSHDSSDECEEIMKAIAATKGWKIRVAIPDRVGLIFGRYVSGMLANTYMSMTAFHHDRRLYVLLTKSRTKSETATAIRFQQSLTFIGEPLTGPLQLAEDRPKCLL